jgi:hypothetical protein
MELKAGKIKEEEKDKLFKLSEKYVIKILPLKA